MTHIGRPRTPRLSPLSDKELTPQQQDVVHPSRRTYALNITRTLAHNPSLLGAWTTFASHLINASSLPARDREILILRTGLLCDCAYELAQHRVIAKQSGLNDSEIESILHDGSALSPFDKTLLQAADELVRDQCLSDATWIDLTARYRDEQVIDAIFTVGNYTIVSMALNSLGVEIEPDFEQFWVGQKLPGR